MPRADWTPEAQDDLAEIAYYIAVKDRRPETARKNIEEIQAVVNKYAGQPGLGAIHPDLPAETRYLRHKRWAIVYQATDYGIIVVRVIDAARDFRRLFPS